MAILDQFGKIIVNKPKGNYSSTQNKLNYNWVRPRYYASTDTDTFKCLNPYEKTLYHQLARDLFRSSCNIRSAITRKNSWACSNGFRPIYYGLDQEYGKLLIEYLNTVVLPNCNTAGQNYTFNRTLLTIANEIDVGGDAFVVFVQSRDGLLRMSIYPSSIVGQRNFSETIVQSGRYKGNNIFDGVVYDSYDTPIAYSILQNKKEDDYYMSSRNSQLLFEPEEGRMMRGISIIAAPLITALNQQDIEEYLTRTIKLESKMGVIFNTKTGTGEEHVDGYTLGSEEAVTGTTTNTQPYIHDMGDYIFLDARNNESAQSFEPKQPGDRVADWVRSIEEKVLYALGWHLALISPNSIGSYAARVMESQVQQMISTRQQTLKRIAKLYCVASIARAIDTGIIPQPKNNSSDWRNIDFSMPPEFQIDSYYGAQTSMQQWQTGNASLQQITAKQGIDWINLRNQRENEADDALLRADRLSKKWNISLERALDLITKQTTNALPKQEISTNE